jgi:hypothetical protein
MGFDLEIQKLSDRNDTPLDLCRLIPQGRGIVLPHGAFSPSESSNLRENPGEIPSGGMREGQHGEVPQAGPGYPHLLLAGLCGSPRAGGKNLKSILIAPHWFASRSSVGGG